jgi:hypothetical protein
MNKIALGLARLSLSLFGGQAFASLTTKGWVKAFDMYGSTCRHVVG